MVIRRPPLREVGTDPDYRCTLANERRPSGRRSPGSRRGCSAGAFGAVLVHATVVLGVLPLRPGALLLPAVGAVVAGLVAPARYATVLRAIGAGRGPRSTSAMPFLAVLAAAVAPAPG
jgi:hypothetical protein